MKKILIVEDEKQLIAALEEKLHSTGYATVAVRDGEQGLKAAYAEKPDLILLDIVMPVMDGMTMLEKLRKDERGKDIPVIILTNLSDGDKKSASAEQGVSDYLIKANWTLDELMRKIEDRIGK